MTNRSGVPARNTCRLPIGTVGDRDEHGDSIRNAVRSDCPTHRGHPTTSERPVVGAAEPACFVDCCGEVRIVARWQGARDLFAGGVDDDGMIDEYRARRLLEECERSREDVVLERRVAGVAEGASEWELAVQRAWRGDLDGHLPD